MLSYLADAEVSGVREELCVAVAQVRPGALAAHCTRALACTSTDTHMCVGAANMCGVLKEVCAAIGEVSPPLLHA